MADIERRLKALSADKRALLLRQLGRRQAGAHKRQVIARRAPGVDRCPLSFGQQRLWFLDRYAPGNPVYNLPWIVSLTGPLNASALEWAINEIVRRHEVLRTTLATEGDVPVQVIAPSLSLTLEALDIRGTERAERAARARRLAAEHARRPFDLVADPPLRAAIVRLAEDEHWLLLTMHHIASDGWSMEIFFRELADLYAARIAGRPSPLGGLPIQYADFAIWQRHWLSSGALEEQLAYWREQLGGDLPALELLADRPRPPVQTFRGARYAFFIPADVAGDLRGVGRAEDATLFMVLLAAFQTLLWRLTGQEDIVLGSAVAGRNRIEVEPLIGFFVNMLVLRVNFGGDPTFREILGRVRKVTLQAYDHQDVPFERLVDVLRPERDPSRTPLFQVGFTLASLAAEPPALPGLASRFIDPDLDTAKFDLDLAVFEGEGALAAALDYSTDLFEEASVARLARCLNAVLAAVAADPGRRASDLPLVDEPERHRMLVDWNDTARPFPCRCVHELFEEQAARTPDAVALDYEGRRLVTYGELNRRSNQLARYLRCLGVGPETLVGVLAERSPETVVAVLGVLKAGGAYLPMEPGHPRERLQFMLDDAGVAVVLTQHGLAGLGEDMGARVVCLDSDWDEVAREGEDDPPPVAAPSNLAYVIYTSGSTGRPKGVLIEHRAVANFISSMRDIFEVTPRDRVLQFASLCFDVSVSEIFTTLLSGATLVMGGRETVLSPPALTQLMRGRGVTITDLPPVMMTLLSAEEFTTHRIVSVGGEAFSGELVHRWALPGRRFFNCYGPTEATVTATIKECTGTWDRSPPIGRPMPNHEVYILDRRLNPVPVGVPGEMYIGGAGLARGYLGRPDLTAEMFIANPWSLEPGARLYRTGDLARYLANGDVDFLGRVDRQVKIRGFRIELGEVEAALARCPGVKQAVVVAREDAPGSKRLAAYLLVEDGGAPNVGDLRASLQKQLPGYMVPSAFVFLAAFPMTEGGKVDLRALPAPGPERPGLGHELTAPRTALEEALAGEVFSFVLGLNAVGVNDNFFELGGNSLQVTQVFSRVRARFGVDLPLRVIFETPTVAGLARAVAAALGDQAPAPAPAAPPSAFSVTAEAVLDEDVMPQGPAPSGAGFASALLTGATGFVGAFLLDALLRATRAQVYCLVRAGGEAQGMMRIRDSLSAYGLWDNSLAGRVIPVPGDLERPLLGLSAGQFADLASSLDVVFHCAAQINAVLPYASIKAGNVLGTHEALRLAAQGRMKPVHYISSLSVFGGLVDPARPLRETDDPEMSGPARSGYAQSKRAAERLVALAGQRGLPVCIHRLGRVAGHSLTGACHENDFLWRLVKGCVQLGLAPEMGLTVSLTPADCVARAVVCLAGRPESWGQAFHLVNPDMTTFDRLIDYAISLGYRIDRAPYPAWLSRLRDDADRSSDNALYPLLASLGRPPGPELDCDCSRTLSALAADSIGYPAVDDGLLHTYFSHFIRSGYLDAPPAMAGTSPGRT